MHMEPGNAFTQNQGQGSITDTRKLQIAVGLGSFIMFPVFLYNLSLCALMQKSTIHVCFSFTDSLLMCLSYC